MKYIVPFVLLLFSLTSCAQKTVFFSDPPGAQVKVNGEVIGETPCTFQYKTGTGQTYEVEITKEEHEPVHQQIKADEVDKKSMKKWLAAGVVWSPLWVGTFFTKKLKDSYHFMLKNIKAVGSYFTPQDNGDLVKTLSFKETYSQDEIPN